MLSEISQTQQEKYHMFCLMWKLEVVCIGIVSTRGWERWGGETEDDWIIAPKHWGKYDALDSHSIVGNSCSQ